MFLRVLTFGALSLLPAPLLGAQDDLASRIRGLERAVAALRDLPGVNLKVNGEVVPPEAWQRSLVYIAGSQLMEKKILQFIIEDRIDELVQEELDRKKEPLVEPRVKARLEAEEEAFKKAHPGKSWDEWLQAHDSSRADRTMEIREEVRKKVHLPNEKALAAKLRAKWLQVKDAEIQKRIDETIKRFQEKNPDQDFWKIVARTGNTKKDYWNLARTTMLFNRLFFPGKPDEWPSVTREAIYASAGQNGKAFFDNIAKAVNEGKQKQVPPLFMAIFQKWCLKKFKEWADIRYASDGLDPKYVLSFNGRTWSTREAFRQIEQSISPVDRNRALLEIVLRTALRQELRKKGFWIDRKEFKKAWEKHVAPFKGSIFTIDVIALTFKGYPSMEAYRARFRLIEGFRRMLEKQGGFDDAHLAAFVPKVERFLGNGTVDLELIRFPAKDDSVNRWIPHGFEMAKARADLVLSQIEKGEITFERAREDLGTWPPEAKHGGILSRKARNELRKELGENEYMDFLQGFSMGDFLFDEAPVGKIVGPLRSVEGWYLAKVVRRYPATQAVTLKDPKMKDMIVQEYQVRKFMAWADEVAARIRLE